VGVELARKINFNLKISIFALSAGVMVGVSMFFFYALHWQLYIHREYFEILSFKVLLLPF